MSGEALSWWNEDFDGIMHNFRGSKTDQYNEGARRYVGSTDSPRCLIRALREWVALQPDHFQEGDGADPLFLLPNGRLLTRAEMQSDLRVAAVAFGVSEQRVGTHSLRVSCATWLYQAGYSVEHIKRHGRWVSNAVHYYLWEGSGLQGMAKAMANVDFVLHAHL